MERLDRRHRVQSIYDKIPNPVRRYSLKILDGLDLTIYIMVGVAFVLAAVMALAYSLLNLGSSFQLFSIPSNVGSYVLAFVSDLLLVLIIMEVLGTIRSYLERGDTSVKPFIFIGMISATRGILSIGARLALASSTMPDHTPQAADDFRNNMIELGINAGIIILLGATLRIMGKFAEEQIVDTDGPGAAIGGAAQSGDLPPPDAATAPKK